MRSKKTTSTSKNNKPTHEVFQVIETGKEKSYWQRIGAAWAHEDGDGLTVTLQALPLDGRLIVRTVKRG